MREDFDMQKLLNLMHCHFSILCFIFELSYINSVRGFHRDNPIHRYSAICQFLLLSPELMESYSERYYLSLSLQLFSHSSFKLSGLFIYLFKLFIHLFICVHIVCSHTRAICPQSGLTLKFLTHLEFIFVQGERPFSFLQWLSTFSSTIC
jgi:hypothetical protein